MGSPFPTVTHSVSISSADVIGDGILDQLTRRYISDNVSVLIGNEAGVVVTSGRREIKAADVDGDGDINFFAINYGGNNVIAVLRMATPPSHR